MKKRNNCLMLALAVSTFMGLASCGTPAGEKPHDHVWTEASHVDATCKAKGSKTFNCTVEGCQETKVEEVAKLTTHSFGDWTTTNPTCNTDGVKERECSVCGTTEEETIPSTGKHTYLDTNLVTVASPTLTKEGIQTNECTVCHNVSKTTLDKSTEAFKTTFEDDFKNNNGNGRWRYGFTKDYFEGVEGVFTFNELTLNEAKDEWMTSEAGVNIKNNWIKADGALAIAGYKVTNDVDRLNFKVSFDSAAGTKMFLRMVVLDENDNKVGDPVWLGDDGNIWSREQTLKVSKNQTVCFLFDGADGDKNGTFHIDVEEVVADLKNDYSVEATGSWIYGCNTHFDWGTNTFTFKELSVNTEWKEWNSDECIIKSDWIKTSYDDGANNKGNAVIGYKVEDLKVGKLNVNLEFNGNEDNSRVAARIFVVSKDGTYKTINGDSNHFFLGGDFARYWNDTKEVSVENGDTIYVVFFPEGDHSPFEGHIRLVIKG